MKSPTLKKLFNEFTHNELALYLLLGVALLNLLTYLQYNYLGGIVIFLFVGLLATHYTKNMVLVLASAILITNLLVSLGFLSNLGYKSLLMKKTNLRINVKKILIVKKITNAKTINVLKNINHKKILK